MAPKILPFTPKPAPKPPPEPTPHRGGLTITVTVSRPEDTPDPKKPA